MLKEMGYWMNAIVARPAAQEGTAVIPLSRTVIHIRRLIGLYLVLLVLEGALRKWAFPQFSNPLLIVRDPVVIVIYLLALRAGVFPRGAYIVSLGIIAVLSFIAGLIVL